MIISCPQCGKVVGERVGDHIEIKKINLMVYEAKSMPRKCPRCGTIFDMLNGKKGD